MEAFYERAMSDPVIGFIFVDVAHLDLQEHLPRIASFWQTILLGEHTYTGNPFAAHARLHKQVELRSGHFERWLGLWSQTVDELFIGERAEAAKVHARRVASAFRRRLDEHPSAADDRPDGLIVLQHSVRPHDAHGEDAS